MHGGNCWQASLVAYIFWWMLSFLRAFNFKDVKAQLRKFTLNLCKWSLFFCYNSCLLRQTLECKLNFLWSFAKMHIVEISAPIRSTTRACLRLLSWRCLNRRLIAYITVLSMRIVPRLNVIYKLSDLNIPKVRVLVKHDQVFHDFIESFFTSLEKRCLDSSQRLLVQLPQIEGCRLELALNLSFVTLFWLLSAAVLMLIFLAR